DGRRQGARPARPDGARAGRGKRRLERRDPDRQAPRRARLRDGRQRRQGRAAARPRRRRGDQLQNARLRRRSEAPHGQARSRRGDRARRRRRDDQERSGDDQRWPHRDERRDRRLAAEDRSASRLLSPDRDPRLDDGLEGVALRHPRARPQGNVAAGRRSRPAAVGGGRGAPGARVARRVRQDRPRSGLTIMLRPTSSAVRRLASAARNAALLATAILALVGLLAGAVRVLPWLLDPAVPWRVAQPFARGLAAVSLEAALLVGWPIGWALACFRFVERGEARVLQTLGQPPFETVARLMPRGTPLALVLAA